MGCSSAVQRPLMMRCVVGSIPHDGFIDLSFVPASDLRLVQQRSWYLWDGAPFLAANRKE